MQSSVATKRLFVRWLLMAMPAQVRQTLLSLLEQRPTGATVCPSEVARAIAALGGDSSLGAETWREEMPMVHAVVDQLVADRAVKLSWKGHALKARAGPYRIAAADLPD